MTEAAKLLVFSHKPILEIAKAFCKKALYEPVCSEAITVTTFREGDKADTGYRKLPGKRGSQS